MFYIGLMKNILCILILCNGHDGKNPSKGSMVNMVNIRLYLSQLLSSACRVQLAYNAAPTSEWVGQTAPHLEFFGVHEASLRHYVLCSQSQELLQYVVNRIETHSDNKFDILKGELNPENNMA